MRANKKKGKIDCVRHCRWKSRTMGEMYKKNKKHTEIQSLADAGSLLEVASKPSGRVRLQRAFWPPTATPHELCEGARKARVSRVCLFSFFFFFVFLRDAPPPALDAL